MYKMHHMVKVNNYICVYFTPSFYEVLHPFHPLVDPHTCHSEVLVTITYTYIYIYIYIYTRRKKGRPTKHKNKNF